MISADSSWTNKANTLSRHLNKENIKYKTLTKSQTDRRNCIIKIMVSIICYRKRENIVGNFKCPGQITCKTTKILSLNLLCFQLTSDEANKTYFVS